MHLPGNDGARLLGRMIVFSMAIEASLQRECEAMNAIIAERPPTPAEELRFDTSTMKLLESLNGLCDLAIDAGLNVARFREIKATCAAYRARYLTPVPPMEGGR